MDPRGAPLPRVEPRWVKPNIVVLVLDDVGFGHPSAFGGFIPTPNIERIAERGLRYTSFHVSGSGPTSRAALLTGRDLRSERIPTGTESFAQVLRASGYSTYAVGRWANTAADEVSPDGPPERWPGALGFDTFYGFFGAATNQWAPALWLDRRPVDPAWSRQGYLLDGDIGDHAVKFIQEKDESGEPFLLLLAPSSGHAPHHAPRTMIERNEGRFDLGWDVVRAETFERQKRAGLVPRDAAIPDRPGVIPAWKDLEPEAKRLFARMQEVQAATLEYADAQLGRVLDELEETGMLDNTIIVVTSDGGASGEGGLLGTANVQRLANGLPPRLDVSSVDDLGGPKTLGVYPAGWALAGNTPGRSWKQTLHEGGLRVPLVISWPKGIKARGELRPQFVHVADVAPTLLELARVPPASNLDGKSFVPTLGSPETAAPRTAQSFESAGWRAVWASGWKAVSSDGRWPWEPAGAAQAMPGRWELYDLTHDPNEAVDLTDRAPEKLSELLALLEADVVAQRVSALDATGERAARRRHLVYRGVTRRTPESLSVPVKNRSHTIIAKVRAPADATLEGVLATCGGRFGGYALYVDDGKLTYVHNYLGEQRYVIRSTDPIYGGERELRFVFEKTGEHRGTGRLFIDGVPVGEGRIPQTVPLVYSTSEGCDTGIDSGTAAGDYEAPFRFNGWLYRVEIAVADDE